MEYKPAFQQVGTIPQRSRSLRPADAGRSAVPKRRPVPVLNMFGFKTPCLLAQGRMSAYLCVLSIADILSKIKRETKETLFLFSFFLFLVIVVVAHQLFKEEISDFFIFLVVIDRG